MDRLLSFSRGRTRTYGLQVMSLASCQLLHPASNAQLLYGFFLKVSTHNLDNSLGSKKQGKEMKQPYEVQQGKELQQTYQAYQVYQAYQTYHSYQNLPIWVIWG